MTLWMYDPLTFWRNREYLSFFEKSHSCLLILILYSSKLFIDSSMKRYRKFFHYYYFIIIIISLFIYFVKINFIIAKNFIGFLKYLFINAFNAFKNTSIHLFVSTFSEIVKEFNFYDNEQIWNNPHSSIWLILFSNVEQCVHIDRGKPLFIHAIRAVSLLDWIIRYRSLGRGRFNLVFHREYVSSSVRFYPRRINLYKREVPRVVSL